MHLLTFLSLRKYSACLYVLLSVWGLNACQTPPNEPPRFTKLTADKTGVNFNNEIARFEGDSLNASEYDPMYNGAGVGVGDFNRDGKQDLFFAGNKVSSRLYLNGGDFNFTDVTGPAGVQTTRWCSGVSVADVNQDGWPDIYVSVSGPEIPANPQARANLLFINQGQKGLKSGTNSQPATPTFREEAEAYGLADTGMSTQAAFFDYDHDGDLDCYVLTNALERVGRNRVRPKRINGEGPSTDRLYINKLAVDSHFVPSSMQLEGYGLGLAITDLNDDGWLDVYCANDFVSNDLLWINNAGRPGLPPFTDRAAEYFKHTSFNSMGVDIQDINNDSRPDVMVVDMLPETNARQKMMLIKTSWDYFAQARQFGYQDEYVRNTLQLNMGGGFSEIGQLAGVHATDWSWAPLLTDLDNDGWKDLVISNGYRRDITNLDFVAYLNSQASSFGDGYSNAPRQHTLDQLYKLPEIKLHNYVYQNNHDLTFSDQSETWGLGDPTYSNGAVYADLDNDGDLDLVFNNIDDPAGIYRNETITPGKPIISHFLRFQLPADAHGLGASVYVTLPDGTQQRIEAHTVRGYASSVEPFVHVGLGKHQSARAKIRWADGSWQDLGSFRADTVYSITYKPSPASAPPPSSLSSLFSTLPGSSLGLTAQHQETPYNDFAQTPTLPHLLCKEGPAVAVADVDGNGLDDVFIGADPGKTRSIFLQKTPGRFTQLVQGANDLEDTGVLFFDADADGDQDLYVVSGGSMQPDSSGIYQDRLYQNDGTGKLTRMVGVLPPTTSSGSCIVAADFDRDGDLDLFRGGRFKVGQFPLTPRSYLLRNDGTSGNPRFTDVTDQLAPGLRYIGMVTAALWTDPDRDNYPDLLLAGEYMPIVLFANGKQNSQINRDGVQFTHRNAGPSPTGTPDRYPFTHSPGLWSSLAQADLDGDGDLDYLAGNLGLNSRLKATANEPLRIYAADFDQNGRLDPVMTFYLKGQESIVPIRDVLNEQMTTLSRKRFTSYTQFAETKFEDAFTSEERERATVVEATELRSCWIENKGNGAFALHPLPNLAQISPITGIQTGDFNADGLTDALLVGNSYAPETYTGWYDAGRGTLLLGVAGKNRKWAGFQAVDPATTGLAIDQDAKAIAPIKIGKETWFVVTNNNGQVQWVKKR